MEPAKNCVTTASTWKKKKGKSLFRRINDWLHLWLGLISGIIIVIVSVTGCIYVFEREISSLTKPYQFVQPQNKPYLLPSQLETIARKTAFGNKASDPANKLYGIQYADAGKAAIAAYMEKENGYTMIYINPYTGEVLKHQALNKDFFRIVLMGHYYLWLPPAIGQPIVAWSILVFVVMLISGLIMWWPKRWNKATKDASFKIKWKANWKRVNYDLHNVLGFYVLLIALVIALTGLVWGFEWFSKGAYWITSGGKSLASYEVPVSDTTIGTTTPAANPIDRLWLQLQQEYKSYPLASIQLGYPDKAADPIEVYFNPEQDTYYKREFRYFDRNTLQELKGGGLYGQKYATASTADKIYRMNYDIHVGAILGWPGKILAFFASFICGSLPITGFYIWWGKKKKQKKKGTAPVRTVTSTEVVPLQWN
jgi:uncharacterized iron-regulated membrane protein